MTPRMNRVGLGVETVERQVGQLREVADPLRAEVALDVPARRRRHAVERRHPGADEAGRGGQDVLHAQALREDLVEEQVRGLLELGVQRRLVARTLTLLICAKRSKCRSSPWNSRMTVVGASARPASSWPAPRRRRRCRACRARPPSRAARRRASSRAARATAWPPSRSRPAARPSRPARCDTGSTATAASPG